MVSFQSSSSKVPSTTRISRFKEEAERLDVYTMPLHRESQREARCSIEHMKEKLLNSWRNLGQVEVCSLHEFAFDLEAGYGSEAADMRDNTYSKNT
jgi:hypothetical protein